MNVQAVGKFLQRYGVPIVIGSLLAFGLIFTSLQTSDYTVAPQRIKTTPSPSRGIRVYQTAPAKPTADIATGIAQASTVTEEPSPSLPAEAVSTKTIVTQAAGQPALATQTAGSPALETSTQAVNTPTPDRPGQPTNTPTTTSPAQTTEAGAVISNGPNLREPRTGFTMTRLSNGRVLFVGGRNATSQHLSSVDLFDPASGVFSPLSSLPLARHDHTAALLWDGRVLVTGGYNTDEFEKWLSDAYVYDFNTSVWTEILPTYSHGTNHTATLMANGQVLVVGGCFAEDFCNDAVEIYEPTTNEWLDMAPLDFSLFGHTAQLLNNGRVLVAGGMSDKDNHPGENAVVYNPEQDLWTPTGPMVDPRYFAESVRLADGRILVVGGLSIEALPEYRTLSSAEIYDPATNQWTASGSLSQARYGFQLVKVSDQHVLAIGGTRSHESSWNANSFVSEIERYDTTTKSWRTIGLLPRPAAFAASVLLPDGRVWLAGGRNNTIYFQDTWFITNVP